MTTPAQNVDASLADALGEICLRAAAAGPGAYADEFTDEGWPIDPASRAAQDGEPLLVHMPVKLATLAAAELEAIGSLLISDPRPKVGAVPLGRSVIESCSTVGWLLDNTVTAGIRRRRAWLLRATAEALGARTAEKDGGLTGAMSGSPERLAQIEADIEARLGLRLERGTKTHPKDWKRDGVRLPSRSELVDEAVMRWFPGADGLTMYSQISRNSHSDVLVALGYIDDKLHIPEGEGLGFVATVLASWALEWTRVMSYLGHTCDGFATWRNRMLAAIGRPDLVDP